MKPLKASPWKGLTRLLPLYTLFSIIALLITGCSSNQDIDLIIKNATIYTVDDEFRMAEAVAINKGVFVQVGSNEEIDARFNAKEIIDAKGKTILPGLYDAHGHLFHLAELLDQVDLNGARSVNEVISRLKAYQQEHPFKDWIIGSGWDQNLWANKNFPTKDMLDEHFPDIPVYLSRTDYHAAWVNSAALEIAGITEPEAIDGGEILSKPDGSASGILVDNAMNIFQKVLPQTDAQEHYRQLLNAQDSLLAQGLTSIVDAGLNDEQITLLKQFYAQDDLKIRTYGMIAVNKDNLHEVVKRKPFNNGRFSLRAVKILADGALGSRGACLMEPYSDKPDTKGFLLESPETLEEIIKAVSATPFQINAHAIGDSTNRLLLQLYGKYAEGKKDARWRIEHAQILKEEDFKYFKEHRIIPSIQPIHAISDMGWAEDRIGPERISNAYAYKKLLDNSGLVAIGTDFPVEHFNPFHNFHAAVARKDEHGNPNGGFQIENALSRKEVLKGMTIWAAYSCFQEKKRGSIEKGKDADLIILNKDPMTVDLEEIRDIKVLRTIIGGEILFKKGEPN